MCILSLGSERVSCEQEGEDHRLGDRPEVWGARMGNGCMRREVEVDGRAQSERTNEHLA